MKVYGLDLIIALIVFCLSFQFSTLIEIYHGKSYHEELVYIEEDISQGWVVKRSVHVFPAKLTLRFTFLGDHVTLRLKRNTNIHAHVPIFVERKGQAFEHLLPSESRTSFYQDAAHGAAIGITCEGSISRDCTRQFRGYFMRNNVYHVIEPVQEDNNAKRETSSRKHRVRQTNSQLNFTGDYIYEGDLPRPKLNKNGRDQTRNGRGRQRRSAQVLKVEFLPVVDYAVFEFWYQRSTASDKTSDAMNQIREFYAYVINSMDVRYQSLAGVSFTIQVVYSGIFIADSSTVSSWTYSSKVSSTPRDQVSSSTALTNFKNWLSTTTGLPHYDHAMLFTGLDLTSSSSGTAAAGLAYLSGICDSSFRGCSITEDHFDAVIGAVAAHELGHNLGAGHDGSGNGCPADDKYIMSPSAGGVTDSRASNHFIFSSCSAGYFQELVDDLDTNNENCMTVLDSSHDPNALDQYLATPAGQVYAIDDQCRIIKGNSDGYFCRQFHSNMTEICGFIYCGISGSSSCSTATAWDGTSCGSQKWCVGGKCVYDQNAPVLEEGCLFGDNPGIISNGLECPALIQGSPWTCYQSSNLEKCCASCANYSTGRTGCEYGDRSSSCDVNYCQYYSQSVRDSTCCQSCYVPHTGSTSTSSTTTAQAQTTIATTTSTSGSTNAQSSATHSVLTSASTTRLTTASSSTSTASNSCPNGDNSNVLIGGQPCSVAISSSPNDCYSSSIYEYCCASCDLQNRHVSGCEYGDRSSSCNLATCPNYDDYSRDVVCCQTCAPSTTAAATTTTTTTLPTSTSQTQTTIPTPTTTTDPTSTQAPTTQSVTHSVITSASTTSASLSTASTQGTTSISTSSSSCPNGDSPNVLIGGQPCSAAIPSSPNDCYSHSIYEYCCASCDLQNRHVSGCEYGDRSSSCDPATCPNYDDYSRDVVCCQTCAPSTTSAAATTSSTTTLTFISSTTQTALPLTTPSSTTQTTLPLTSNPAITQTTSPSPITHTTLQLPTESSTTLTTLQHTTQQSSTTQSTSLTATTHTTLPITILSSTTHTPLPRTTESSTTQTTSPSSTTESTLPLTTESSTIQSTSPSSTTDASLPLSTSSTTQTTSPSSRTETTLPRTTESSTMQSTSPSSTTETTLPLTSESFTTQTTSPSSTTETTLPLTLESSTTETTSPSSTTEITLSLTSDSFSAQTTSPSSTTETTLALTSGSYTTQTTSPSSATEITLPLTSESSKTQTTSPSSTTETTLPLKSESFTTQTTSPYSTTETTLPLTSESSTTQATSPSSTTETTLSHTSDSSTAQTTSPSSTKETTLPFTSESFTTQTTAPSSTTETTLPLTSESSTTQTTLPSSTTETTLPLTSESSTTQTTSPSSTTETTLPSQFLSTQTTSPLTSPPASTQTTSQPSTTESYTTQTTLPSSTTETTLPSQFSSTQTTSPLTSPPATTQTTSQPSTTESYTTQTTSPSSSTQATLPLTTTSSTAKTTSLSSITHTTTPFSTTETTLPLTTTISTTQTTSFLTSQSATTQTTSQSSTTETTLPLTTTLSSFTTHTTLSPTTQASTTHTTLPLTTQSSTTQTTTPSTTQSSTIHTTSSHTSTTTSSVTGAQVIINVKDPNAGLGNNEAKNLTSCFSLCLFVLLLIFII